MEWSRAVASSRAQSEDRLLVAPHGDSLVVLIADGTGGIAGGAAAADALVDAVAARLARPSFDAFDVRAWSETFVEADSALARRGGGETTGVLVVASEYALAGVSVGDSEAWVISAAGAIDRLTERQSRARVGSGRANPIAFHRRKLEGTLAVATDGLFGHASAAAIAGCTPLTAEALAELPRLASGAYPDDVAVAVVRA